MSGAAQRISSPLGIAEGVLASARRTPDHPALIVGALHLTYASLAERTGRVAAAAQSLGLKSGDRALLCAGNRLEYMEVVLGLGRIGVATATPSPRSSPAELAAILADCRPRLVIAEAELAPALAGAGAGAGVPVHGFGPDYEAWLAAATPADRLPPVDEALPFAIPYTSGTTGKPKGVLLSHRSRVLTALALGIEYGCFGPMDRHLAVAPLCHGAGFAFAQAALQHGGTCVLMERFDAETYLRRLADTAATGTFLVPTHFHAIFALAPEILAQWRGTTPHLKTIISNAAPLPTATKLQILDYWGDGKLFECYGSTEAGIVSNLRPSDQRRKEQCVGTAFPLTEIALRGEDGQAVAAGEIGELFSRSPYDFSGYLDRPEETRAALAADGWLSVGDLARRDEEGYLSIVGRKKDMILSGGINVYPREIEEVLMTHPAVREVSVAGVPDAYWGEAVRAYVVRSAPVEAPALLEFVKARLAGYKQPRAIVFLDSLPRGPTGKILKTALAGWPPSEAIDAA